MDAEHIVRTLLESDEQVDPKAFIQAHGHKLDGPSRDHLFVSSADGGLYDTRKPDWHKGPPVRQGYQQFHREINTPEQFKATWRARHHSNYPVAFLTDDGAFLCEECTKNNLGRILSSIRSRARDGWRVVGIGQCHGSMDDEPGDMNDQCANCNKNLGEVA
jgi:hypothetical protein